jgi:structural maintenance of chromosome 1
VKLKEALANLRKVFPGRYCVNKLRLLARSHQCLPHAGVHGRVIDLCKPTQQKYNVAIQVVLGRNIDSVVVDHQKTAIECIEVLQTRFSGAQLHQTDTPTIFPSICAIKEPDKPPSSL